MINVSLFFIIKKNSFFLVFLHSFKSKKLIIKFDNRICKIINSFRIKETIKQTIFLPKKLLSTNKGKSVFLNLQELHVNCRLKINKSIF